MPKYIYLGVNRVNYQKESNKTIYSLCGDQVQSMQLRKKLLASIMVHTLVCENQQVELKAEYIVHSFPRVTRESFIRDNSNFRKTLFVML